MWKRLKLLQYLFNLPDVLNVHFITDQSWQTSGIKPNSSANVLNAIVSRSHGTDHAITQKLLFTCDPGRIWFLTNQRRYWYYIFCRERKLHASIWVRMKPILNVLSRIHFDSWPRYWGCQVAVLYSEIFHGCKHWHCELCCLIQRHQDGNQSSLLLFPQHFTKFVIDLKYSSTTEDLIKVNFEEFSIEFAFIK